MYSILTIILFEYFLLVPNAGGEGSNCLGEAENFQECVSPPWPFLCAPIGPLQM